MKFSKEIVINAPAEKVWDILAHQFTDIGKYARAVPHSSINNDAPKISNSPVGGRLCDTSIGKISEEFTAYDEEGMTFSFKGVITSIVFSSVISTNSVIAIDANTSKHTVTPNITLKPIGFLMYPLMKIYLGKTIMEGMRDLKYFAENDKPSPEKLASLK
ncbi:MAG: hypothetical protein ACI92I_000696 [Acidimicrobiales bacterium]|jgi:hypothetical protein